MYISSSNLHSPYTARIATKIGRLAKSDPTETWCHFLRDHIYQLRSGSITVTVTPEEMNRYRYRVRDYLSRVLNINIDIELAFRILNRLESDLDFNDDVTTIKIPSMEYVSILRSKYNTVIANYKRKSA